MVYVCAVWQKRSHRGVGSGVQTKQSCSKGQSLICHLLRPGLRFLIGKKCYFLKLHALEGSKVKLQPTFFFSSSEVVSPQVTA